MRNILVAGATGHQGRAFLHALQATSNSEDFHVLGLTRTPTSAAAQRLSASYPDLVTLVQGDLNEPQSIRKVFDDAKGGIWGVFCVLEFPGLGVSTEGEERQGKALADIALEHRVSLFVYSSAEYGGEYYEDQMVRNGAAKVLIERHIKSLGEQGLPWTIIQPAFFMENYEGFLGAITVGVLKCGLKDTTTVRMVAAEDIGGVAVAVFKNPGKYTSKALVISGEVTTLRQQEEVYRKATGRQLPAIPWLMSRALLALNSHTRDLITDLERKHEARESGKCSDVEGQAATAREAYPEIQTFERWARTRVESKADNGDNWNKVSIVGLLTGRQ